MMKFLLIAGLFLANLSDTFLVKLQMLKPVNADELTLHIQAKNLSDSTVNVLKDRRHDFRRERVRSIGNYIIEIERKKSHQFHLFMPSADINPGYSGQEYIEIKPGETIIDTILISGRSFSVNGSKGFPSGSYRLRLSFKPDEWSDLQINRSDWIRFEIE